MKIIIAIGMIIIIVVCVFAPLFKIIKQEIDNAKNRNYTKET